MVILEVKNIINQIILIILCALILISTCAVLIVLLLEDDKKVRRYKKDYINKIENYIEEVEKCNEKSDYVKPKFKELTQEQIDDIHARGKITPAEQVKEWEEMGLCAPGDAIGSAAWRCEKFRNCHDCLIDYANQHDEYISFFDFAKEFKPYDDIEISFLLKD